MRSKLFLGAFLVSTFVSVVANLAESTAAQGQGRPVRALAYEIFGQSPKREKLADKLTVVTLDSGCPWCDQFKPVVEQLKARGYEVEVLGPKNYKPSKGDPKVSAYPFLIFRQGGKAIDSNKGYLPIEKVTPKLVTPAPKPTK